MMLYPHWGEGVTIVASKMTEVNGSLGCYSQAILILGIAWKRGSLIDLFSNHMEPGILN